MGSKEWQKAAELVEKQKRQPDIEAREIEQEARKLDSFLAGLQGEAAKRLLKATEKHIILGVLPASPGHEVVYFLDGDGLKKSIQGAGLAGFYENKESDVSSTTPEKAIRAFTNSAHGMRKRSEIYDYLRDELDTIAESVPRK